MNPDSYTACFDLTGGALWRSYSVVTNTGSAIISSSISETLQVPTGTEAQAGNHGVVGPGGTTVCVSFTVGTPNDSTPDELRFEDLTIADNGCSLAGGGPFDLHVRLYDEQGFVLYDEDWDLNVVCSSYATTCSFDKGVRHIDVNKHREAFICDETDPDKDIFESYDFDDPALDCPTSGCTHRPGEDPDTSSPAASPQLHCDFEPYLDPDTGTACDIDDIDAWVQIHGAGGGGADGRGVCSVRLDDPDGGSNGLGAINSNAANQTWRDNNIPGSFIWDNWLDVQFDLCCNETPLDSRSFDISVRRRVGGCIPSQIPDFNIAEWRINGTLLYSTFASANSKYEQSWWITNYSPLPARILATVYMMQPPSASTVGSGTPFGTADAVLGWVGSTQTTGIQIAALQTAIGAALPANALFWVCFTVQTKAVSGHTVLGTLQNGPAGPVADYTLYKMEYQTGAFTAIPVDSHGRMMFPPYPAFNE